MHDVDLGLGPFVQPAPRLAAHVIDHMGATAHFLRKHQEGVARKRDDGGCKRGIEVENHWHAVANRPKRQCTREWRAANASPPTPCVVQ